jgi:acetyltransferase-like isoleucine patch superfamily enzyme
LLREIGRVLLGGIAQRGRDYKNPSAAEYPGVEFQSGAGAYGACRFGEGVAVRQNTILRDCEVGRYTYFAADSVIANCRVGAFCSVGPEVWVGLGRHPTRDYVSTYPSFYSRRSAGRADFGVTTDFQEYQPVVIGNDVLISARCLILDGVTIGDGSIIGAGAVVARDVPPYAVVGGVPAKVVRRRFDDADVDFLQQLAWWDRDLDWIREHAPLFRDIRLLKEALAAERG